MAVRVSFTVPDHEEQRAVDAVHGRLGEILTLLLGDDNEHVETERVGDRYEDDATDPDAPCCCYDSYRPDPDCQRHGIRVLPELVREVV